MKYRVYYADGRTHTISANDYNEAARCAKELRPGVGITEIVFIAASVFEDLLNQIQTSFPGIKSSEI